VRRADGFFLHQLKYAQDILKCAGMLNCSPAATSVDTNAKLSATLDRRLWMRLTIAPLLVACST
jgi:hypothetical protein